MYPRCVCPLQHGGGTEKGETKNSSQVETGKTAARKQTIGGGTCSTLRNITLSSSVIGVLAILVYYFGEQWLFGPAVNRPLSLTLAVSDEWRKDSEYGTRVWGTYR